MNIQSETVRKYVLDRLEDGSFTSGMRLPGSRKISEELNISRPVVQSALDTLVNEGILKAAQRSGLYVEPEWSQRQIRSSLRVFKSEKPLPWLELFRSELGGQLPELHISTKFRRCPLEIITTAGAQSRHDEFVNLMPILRECYPDLSPFSAEQLQPFTRNGRLTALPFVFSPRLIACSRKMLREAGCAEPSPGWVIADLMNLIAGLRRKFPPERIFSSHTVLTFWINFILSCGSSLFDPENSGLVQFDSAEALDGFRVARALRGPGKVREIPPQECAIMIIDRQTYRRIQDGMKDEWLFLPVPGNVPERTGISMQATELFAVRRGSMDQSLISPIIRFLWSEKFQDHLAELRYGIPIRKSSALRSFAENREPDSLFKRYCPQIRNDYQMHDPDLNALISNGIDQILSGEGALEKEIADLAYVVRRYMKYRGIDCYDASA